MNLRQSKENYDKSVQVYKVIEEVTKKSRKRSSVLSAYERFLQTSIFFNETENPYRNISSEAFSIFINEITEFLSEDEMKTLKKRFSEIFCFWAEEIPIGVSEKILEFHQDLFVSQTRREYETMINAYYSLMMGGQQFSIPSSVAKKLFERNFTNEGFASPINSKFKELGGSYCSAFPEIDKPFGSLGSFFKQELNGNWYINPPFIEIILEEVSKKIQKTLEKEQSQTIVYIHPDWKDSASYEILVKSKYLRMIAVLGKRKYVYINHQDEKITLGNESLFLVLSNDDDFQVENMWSVLNEWNAINK